MATNPQRRPTEDGELSSLKPAEEPVVTRLPAEGRFPWFGLILMIAALIVVVIISLYPSAPVQQPTRPPTQMALTPVLGQVQLTGMSMTVAPVGSAMFVDTMVHNNGPTNITGLQVQAAFQGSNSQTIGTQLRFVAGVVSGSNLDNVRNLVEAPIKPNQVRRVRIFFDNLPPAWNKKPPQMTIVSVTGAAQ